MTNRREQYKEQIDGVSVNLVQHTEPDERFYEHPSTGRWYASVTTKLDVLPKDPFLDYWREKNGAESVNQVLAKASEIGSTIHGIIDDLCKEYQSTGEAAINWFDDNGYKKFNSVVWSAVMKFVDFFNTYVDDILLSEQKMFSDILDVSGTVDGVFMLKDGRTALVDYKYTSVLSEKFSVQTYCYKQMVEETYNMKVDVRGNLWLRSQKRGADKTGKKIQGNGWEFVEHIEEDRDALIYDCANKIFMDKYRNKEIIPEHRTYPTILTIGN